MKDEVKAIEDEGFKREQLAFHPSAFRLHP